MTRSLVENHKYRWRLAAAGPAHARELRNHPYCHSVRPSFYAVLFSDLMLVVDWYTRYVLAYSEHHGHFILPRRPEDAFAKDAL
jgi:hypothetical protein